VKETLVSEPSSQHNLLFKSATGPWKWNGSHAECLFQQFPYAIDALPRVLETKWDDKDFKQYRDAFPQSATESPAAFQAHVEDLTQRDVKIASLKDLQGKPWSQLPETLPCRSSTKQLFV
jgi:hypothetical protein